MKKSSILWGIVLILLAAVILGSGMGYIPDIGWVKILCTVCLAIIAIRSLFKRRFFSTIMSLCLIAWLFEEALQIEDITPFPLLIAGGLLGIGLNLIFGKKEKIVNIKYNGHEATLDDIRAENNWEDGSHVVLGNNFGSVSKYVNSANLISADLESNFGSANIYFNNAVMENDSVTVRAENNFGQMNIYLPRTWRIRMKQDTAFGKINVIGAANNDMDAPFVMLNVECNFGEVNIYFE